GPAADPADGGRMIAFLLGGVILLIVFLLAGRVFVAADPETVKRVLMWSLGVVAVVLVALALEAGLGIVVVLGGLGVGWYLFRGRLQSGGSSQARGQVSE